MAFDKAQLILDLTTIFGDLNVSNTAASKATEVATAIDDYTVSGDHGSLVGLADDDHSQYLNETRHDADDHDVPFSRIVCNNNQVVCNDDEIVWT